MDDKERYRRATAWVGALRGFYAHAAIFSLVNAGLLLLNLLTSPASLWFVWPLVGWGLGLAAHALGVFGARLGWRWEERQIRALVERDGERTREELPGETWPNLRG